MDFLSSLLSLAILVFSAIIHEVSHGFVADKLGDPTPRLSGRLTLKPASHIDPMMSIAVPLLLLLSGSPVIIGSAKPVPIDPFNLKEGRKDVALVALSGPLSNILLAVGASLLIRLLVLGATVIPLEIVTILYWFLSKVVTLNLLLAIFNFIPIPPLDGSKMFALLLSEEHARAYVALGSMGMIIIFFLLMFPVGNFSLGHFIYSMLQFTQSLLIPYR